MKVGAGEAHSRVSIDKIVPSHQKEEWRVGAELCVSHQEGGEGTREGERKEMRERRRPERKEIECCHQ